MTSRSRSRSWSRRRRITRSKGSNPPLGLRSYHMKTWVAFELGVAVFCCCCAIPPLLYKESGETHPAKEAGSWCLLSQSRTPCIYLYIRTRAKKGHSTRPG